MNKNCSDFEILISAAIDGELEPVEFAELESHVDVCDRCRHEYQKMETVTDWLVAHDYCSSAISETDSKMMVETCARQAFSAVLPVNGHAGSTLEKPKPSSASQASPIRGRNFLAGGMLAATAAGLAALLSPGSPAEPSVSIPIKEVSEPAERATVLNEQSLSIQLSQAEVMEQELRVLKLLAQHSNAEPDEIEALNNKIDSLMQRVRSLRNDSLSP